MLWRILASFLLNWWNAACGQKASVISIFAPCKGIQNSPGFWIPRRWIWIPVSLSGTWIPDSNRWWDLGDSLVEVFCISKPRDPFHLIEIPWNCGAAVNEKSFVGSSHWKTPWKSGKSKKVGPFSRLERLERNFVFHLHVSRGLYQFQLLPTRQPSWCPIG